MKAHLIPNWSAGVRETYEYKTTVFTSESGKEQRTALRMTPRRKVEFTALLRDKALRRFQGVLHNRGAQILTIPDPAREGAILVRPAAAGDTVLYLNQAPYWMEVGVDIGISTLDATGQYDTSGGSVASIGAFSSDFSEDYDTSGGSGASVGAFSFDFGADYDIGGADYGATLTLTQPLAEPWPSGAEVRPIISGSLPTSVTLSHETAALANVGVSFDVRVPSEVSFLYAEEGLKFRNREVLLAEPNWLSPPSVTCSTPFSTTDYGRGITATFLPVDFYTRTTQFLFSGRSDETDIMQVLGAFVRAKGRRGEFTMPSWTADMLPAGPIVMGSNLIVQGRQIADDYLTSDVNRAVAILTAQGNWILRWITSAEVVTWNTGGSFGPGYGEGFEGSIDGSELFTRLQVSPAFTANVYQSDILMICWLNVCRFASDALTVEWLTDGVATITVNIQTLEALTAETIP